MSTNETQKLTDTIDLMRDEFRRIKACPSDQWAKPEIDQLCDRAIKQIEQRVPVIVQRDRAEAKVVELRREIATALRRLKNTDPVWAVGAATGVLEKAIG